MTTSTLARPCAKRRREAEADALPRHPLLGLVSAAKTVAELDKALADRSLSNTEKGELLAQLRAFSRAASRFASDLLEESYKRYESTHS